MYSFGNTFSNQYMTDMYSSAPIYFGFGFVPENSYFSYDSNQPDENPPTPQTVSYVEPIVLIEPYSSYKNGEKAEELRETLDSQSEDDDQPIIEEQSLDQRSHGTKATQTYGRNINSNIYHHMVKRIQINGDEQKYFNSLLGKILQKEEYQITEKEFYQLLNKKYGKLPIYISLKKMKDMFRGSKSRFKGKAEVGRKEQEFYKIYRILSRVYLKNVHPCYVYNGLKLKKDSKVIHVKGARVMGELTGPS